MQEIKVEREILRRETRERKEMKKKGRKEEFRRKRK